jgi:hypothetical protein
MSKFGIDFLKFFGVFLGPKKLFFLGGVVYSVKHLALAHLLVVEPNFFD